MENNKTLWKVDASHSEVGFKVRHMMISSVSGSFDQFDVTAETNGDDFNQAQFNFSASIDSISTKNEDRDNHLKSADFFDAENHPEMSFVSKSFDGEKLIGDMTIRGTTKEIELDVEFNGIAQDPYGRTIAGMEASGSLNRKDYNLNWDAVTEAGNIMVGDKVRLNLNFELIKQ